MESKKQNYEDEGNAIKTIGNILNRLSEDARKRVLAWASGAFGVKITEDIDKREENGIVDDNSTTKSQPRKVKDLWAQKQPKTNHQKFAVLAFHLEMNESKQEFTSKELHKTWEDTREATPTTRTFEVSLNDTLTKYHYLVKGSKKGLYRLGSRGEKLVAALPNPSKELLGQAKKSSTKHKGNKQ